MGGGSVMPVRTTAMNEDRRSTDGLCLCGCGQVPPIANRTRYSEGWVKGEPIPFVPHHKRPFLPTNRYAINETGCWIWQGATWPSGYGVIVRHGRRVGAHRYFYEQQVGRIPDGLELDHLCRNRRCVNPAHMEPVARAENIRRGANAKLSEDQVRAIRALKGRAYFKDVAAQFGISTARVHQIWRGYGWRGVGDHP
jgi:hypothetical protein